MKFSFWIPVAAICLLAGCGPDKPAESSSGGVGSGNHQALSEGGTNGTKTAGETQPEMSMPVPPANAQYTLLCMSFMGDNHIVECNRVKTDLLRLTKLKDWYVIHSEKESDLYYGFYTTVDDKSQPEEVERLKNDRAQIGGIANTMGDKIFGNVIPVLINSPDPIAPREWEISQCKGYWTLQIAVYRDSAQRKQAAVDSVKDARARGIEAYYHHSPDSSEVFIGSWPESSVEIQNLKQPENTDPTKPLLVVSQPIPGVVDGKVRNRKGEEMQVVNAPTYVVVDPSLKQAIATYPYTLVNGRLYGRPKELRDHTKTAIPDPSFLVKVPRPGDKTAGDESAPEAGVPDAPNGGADGAIGFGDGEFEDVRAMKWEAGMHLLIASTNSGKIREFREMLGDGEIDFSDLSAYRQLAVVEETGETFRANACLKAAYYARATGQWALADDSGLAVDALGGKPGVHSARWAEMNKAGKGDGDNNKLVLRQLEKIPEGERTARFVCVLALADPEGRIILTAMDSVEGRMLREPRGANGFGYDPLFLIDALGKTTAELEPAEKHRISHRGKALRRMRALMGGNGVFHV